jgi:hypothetical protein
MAKRVRSAPLFQRDLFIDAQQQHRFYLRIAGLKAAYLINVERPSYTIETKTYRMLNNSIEFPKHIKWEPVSFSFREIFTPEAFGSSLGNVLNKLTDLSYTYPNYIKPDEYRNMSKENLMIGAGVIEIQSLDQDGFVHESWKLHNPMITSMKPSQLSYDGEDLTSVDVTVTYDWAEYGYKGVFAEQGGILSGILGGLTNFIRG